MGLSAQHSSAGKNKIKFQILNGDKAVRHQPLPVVLPIDYTAPERSGLGAGYHRMQDSHKLAGTLSTIGSSTTALLLSSENALQRGLRRQAITLNAD